MAVQIQFRRDTSTNWNANNPLLSEGEAGFDITANKFKVGDGVNYWTGLTYSEGVDGTSGTSGINGTSGTSGSSGVDGTSGGADLTGLYNNSILYNENTVVSGVTRLTFSGNSFIWMPTPSTTTQDDFYWKAGTSIGFKLISKDTPASGNGYGITIGGRNGAVGNVSLAATTRADLPSEATGDGCFAWGLLAKATGNNSHAFGQVNTSSGEQAWTCGANNTASGERAAAFNYQTNATGPYSASHGLATTASGHAQMVVGRYNITTGSTSATDHNSPQFIVGTGDNGADYYNSLTVSRNSTIVYNTLALKDVVNGNLYAVVMSGGTLTTYQL